MGAGQYESRGRIARERAPGAATLVSVVDSLPAAQAALAEGADLLDVAGGTRLAEAIAAACGEAVLWRGDPPDLLDADEVAGGPAAAAAAAAATAWTGAAPAVRTRHTRAARRAIDMTAVIAGGRPPARALRGLA